MKKRLRLKKEWRVILGIIAITLTIHIATIITNHYVEWLHKCDQDRGYTCNVFGR